MIVAPLTVVRWTPLPRLLYKDGVKAKTVTSYILVLREEGAIVYWKRGNPGGWTQDLAGARRYAREPAARIGRQTLLKRGINPENFKVEAIEELE